MLRVPAHVERVHRREAGRAAIRTANGWAGLGLTPDSPAREAGRLTGSLAPVPPEFGNLVEAAKDLLPGRVGMPLAGLGIAGEALSGRSAAASAALFAGFAPRELQHAVSAGRSLHQPGAVTSNFQSLFRVSTSGNGGGLVGQLNKSAVKSGGGKQLSFLSQNLGRILHGAGKEFADLLQQLSAPGGADKGLAGMVGCFGKGGGGLGDLFSRFGSLDGISTLAGKLLPFLPPKVQKAAGLALALASMNPVAIIGALTGFLPPELQKFSAAAMPLLTGDLSGSLNALVGQYLPPELQGVWSTLQAMGGVEGLLGVSLPKIPSPFGKMPPRKPPAPPKLVSATVIGGEPPWAARQTDAISCNAGAGVLDPPTQGTVWIGKQLAARITDKGVCSSGPKDTITFGEKTVLIVGLKAARNGDLTGHGGTVKSGFATVWIGKPCPAPKGGGGGSGKGDGKDGDKDSDKDADKGKDGTAGCQGAAVAAGKGTVTSAR